MIHRYVLSAIKKRDVQKTLELIEHPGFDINGSVNKVTCLILASKLGLQSVVQTLVQKGADPNIGDHEGRTALSHACANGTANVVRLLLQSGSKVNVVNTDGDEAIHECVNSGNIATLSVLLDYGVDVDHCNHIGYTPLMLAVLSSYARVVTYLLHRGADVNRVTSEGDSALHFASQVASLDIIATLISAGCHCNKRNKMGETPIAAAAAANKVNVVQFLALSGCHINSHCYISPLATACHSKHYDMVRCLLSEGYNVSRDDTVQHSIFWSMEEEEPELMEYVRYRASHPLSLKHISRLHVRCLLGVRLYQVVSKLEIPQILKDFLVTSSILS